MDRRRLAARKAGETYYGTMSMKAINTLRVEACALRPLLLLRQQLSRITRRADSLMTSRQCPRTALVESQQPSAVVDALYAQR